ncbi:hypothetical protein JHK85_006459 [Glycine max]|uniref:Uncharacterized protein n=1 Tax=Glycine soja TaxID=3848 RepID=A0A445L730_GLYSO|nr:hypothetical protein JHK85_006459 [Glycine max]KAG5071085.1 hypothetical protein JHK86_006296 [Glycine max]RZC19040.1 hypothetical protein D0Y65_006043 [Glycine soja]
MMISCLLKSTQKNKFVLQPCSLWQRCMLSKMEKQGTELVLHVPPFPIMTVAP